jgi:ADP-ribosylglycohydrolase
MNNQTTQDLLSKFHGTIFGLAIGDALGMPAEFLTRKQIKRYYGGEIKDFIKGHPGHVNAHLAAGSYTDDTQLNLIIAESIIKCNKVDPTDIAERLVEWHNSKECRAPGPSIAKACKHLTNGTPWNKSGVHTAGCGASIRVAPIGLYDHANLDKLKEDVHVASVITHNEPKAIAGSIAVAYWVARLISLEELDPKQLIDETADFIQDVDNEMAETMRWVYTLLDVPLEEALFEIGTSGYVLETVPAGIYCFIKSPKNFSKSVLSAVNAGDDADSVACITGALSGAYNGIKGISKKWISSIEDKELLCDIAESLYRASHKAIATKV